jgi:hypothetical protein
MKFNTAGTAPESKLMTIIINIIMVNNRTTSFRSTSATSLSLQAPAISHSSTGRPTSPFSCACVQSSDGSSGPSPTIGFVFFDGIAIAIYKATGQ